MLRRLLARGGAWVLLLAVVSCDANSQRQQVKAADLVGYWTGPNGASLSLSADGSAEVRKLGKPLLFAGPGTIEVGIGRWDFNPNRLEQGPAIDIDLSRVTGTYRDNEIITLRVASAQSIFRFIGDPDLDDRFTFHKEAKGFLTRPDGT